MLVTICVGDNFEMLETISVTNIFVDINYCSYIYLLLRSVTSNSSNLKTSLRVAPNHAMIGIIGGMDDFDSRRFSLSRLSTWFLPTKSEKVESNFSKLTIRNRSIWEHFTKFNCFFLVCRSKITIDFVAWTVITELWFVFKLMWWVPMLLSLGLEYCGHLRRPPHIENSSYFTMMGIVKLKVRRAPESSKTLLTILWKRIILWACYIVNLISFWLRLHKTNQIILY